MADFVRGCARTVLPLALALVQGCSLLPGNRERAAAEEAAAANPLIGVEISGVEDALAENVRAHLSVAGKPCTTPRAYLEALRERSLEEAREALQAYGYYAPDIDVAIDPGGDCPTTRVAIVPGEPVTIGDVTIDIRGPGGTDPAFRERLGEPVLVSGDPLDHAQYGRTRQRIESVALELGYLEGIFVTRRIRVDPARRRADVTLVFDSGPRYALGEIRLEQAPEFLDESLVRRFIESRPGDPYVASQVSAIHRSLSKGAYFNQIDVTPRLSAPEHGTIPIDIRLTPRDRHRVSYGVGASTDEGIRGRAGYLNRRLNRWGHQLDVSLNGSFIEQSFSTGYRIPRKRPADEWLTVQAGVRRRDVDTFDTVETQVALSETKRRPWGIMETRFIELNREDFDVSGTDDTTNFLAPGASWRRTVVNDDLYPTRGYDINFELKGAAEAIVSDTSFVRSVLSAAAVRGLPFDSRAVFRSRFGGMWVDAFDRLPPSERFFAGGDNSIRGYDIDELGPIDASDDVIGGTYLAVVTVELEHYFAGNWGVAVFADTGNAFGGDGSSTGLQTGVGAGVRWRSPVGPIRVDIAHPLDDASNDFRLHLRIGPDF